MSVVAVPPPTLPDHYPPDPRDHKMLYDPGFSNKMDAVYPPQSTATMKSSSGISSRDNTEYLGSRYPRDQFSIAEGHEYLEVDVISRIKALQHEIDLLRCNMNQGSDSSNKSKDSCIYEKIDTFKRDRPRSSNGRGGGFMAYLFKESKERGLFRFANLWDPSYTYCRFLWLILIVIAMALTSYQIYDRVTHYQSTPRRMYVDSRSVDTLSFPIVTICNLNSFRLSRVADLGIYSIIHTLQHARPRQPYISSVENFTQLAAYKLGRFTEKTGHTKEDLVYRCLWQSRPCGVHNFTEIFTGREHCVSFELEPNDGYVNVAGSQSGLHLALNIEQYEYILGPNSAVGAKIALHDRGEIPRSFVHVPVGKLTSVEVTKVEYEYPTATGLEQLLNLRSEWTIPEENCSATCREMNVVMKCHCSLPNTSDAAVSECTMMDWYTCVHRVIDDSEDCGCKRRYEDIDGRYGISLSYAAIPKYGIESELRGLRNRDELEKKFRHALDLYHTYDTIMVQYDTDTLENLLVELSNCTNQTRRLSEYTTKYARLYKEMANQLKDNFAILSITTNRQYLLFDAGSHTSFTSVITILGNSFEYLMDKESQLLSEQQRSMLAVYIEQIFSKLEDMVQTGTASGRLDKKLLTEIEEGLNLFRNDLVTGYGQNYKEMRTKLKYYDDITLKMRNITHIMRSVLNTEYIKLKQLKIDTASLTEIQSKLRSFFNRVKTLNAKERKNLDTHMTSLVTSYRSDRKSIIKSLRNFNETTLKFSALANSTNGVISGINNTLSMLYTRINEANKRLGILTDNYKRNVYGKSEYSDKMNDERLMNDLRQVKESAKALSSDARILDEKSDTINHSINNTAAINFDSSASKTVANTMTWFGNSPLVLRVMELLDLVERSMRNVDDYQKELREFTSSRRINEVFYRNNFLHLDIFYKDMSVTTKREYIAYTLIDLTSDIGCTLALYLGVSILTLFQFIDLIKSSAFFFSKNTT